MGVFGGCRGVPRARHPVENPVTYLFTVFTDPSPVENSVENVAPSLELVVGLNLARIRVVIDIFGDHVQSYHSGEGDSGAVISGPAGKPAMHCKMVAVHPTASDPADALLAEQGPVELPVTRLLRLYVEAFEHRAPLSHEDLNVLLGIDLSTVEDIVRRLRERDLVCPPVARSRTSVLILPTSASSPRCSATAIPPAKSVPPPNPRRG